MDTKFTALTEEQLKSVEGGKNGVVKLPGGTGVYCWNTGKNSAKCGMDWSVAGPYVGKIIVNGWLTMDLGQVVHNFNLYREV
ncbi:hypothetical protein [Streptococcus equi]|uniref:hypothetical protein n=1 Tax=Streptococcus equi TaxID=1336 RepID=UPI001E3C805D|nr:hypothetical protein [Streptococcus equi]MCD3476658.1 hypothetical protein [Streptococcus equi subsp. equi]